MKHLHFRSSSAFLVHVYGVIPRCMRPDPEMIGTNYHHNCNERSRISVASGCGSERSVRLAARIAKNDVRRVLAENSVLAHEEASLAERLHLVGKTIHKPLSGLTRRGKSRIVPLLASSISGA